MKSWRLIDTDLGDPYFVTAADEALALSIGNGTGQDTLHYYRRNPPGVSVGYFRNVNEDVDIDLCNKLGIKIVRRTSAGGSIYTDPDQLIYSLITSKPLGKNVEETFEQVCDCLIAALSNLGISSAFKPPNDILINGKKISGSAQLKKRSVYLIHGTIILDLDQNRIKNILKNHKPGYTSSIREECGVSPDLVNLKAEIKASFEKRFKVKFHPGNFSANENLMIYELLEERYSKHNWNFKR